MSLRISTETTTNAQEVRGVVLECPVVGPEPAICLCESIEVITTLSSVAA